MGLTTSTYVPEVKSNKRIDRKRNKVPHKTLLAHIEFSCGEYKVLDLTNKVSEFPRPIVSKSEFDYFFFCDAIEKYMRSKKFTSFTISFITDEGMQFIN